MKYKNQPISKFKSGLEFTCNELLEESGLTFEYEPITLTLMDPFEYPLESYQKVGKKFKNSQKVRAIRYVPDFIVTDKNCIYLIETKGYLTPVSRLKWKLLKRQLIDTGKECALYMPTNKTQIKETIKLIKDIIFKNQESGARDKS